MEIREITQYSDKSPFNGYGVWIVFEQKYRKAYLLHPIHLTELMLSEYEFVRASGNSLWPVNQTGSSFNRDRFVDAFKKRVIFFVEQQRSFPIQAVAKVIAELDEIEVTEAIKWIASHSESVGNKPVRLFFDKGNQEYALVKGVDYSKIGGRPRVIIEALKDIGPASIYQIIHLVEGKLKTKNKLSRVVTYFVHKLTTQGILEIVA